MGCQVSSAPSAEHPWFTACKEADIGQVDAMLQQHIAERDVSALSIISKETTQDAMNSLSLHSYVVPFQIRVPGFTGLHYAVFYNHKKLIKQLMPSISLNTQHEVKLPVSEALPFNQLSQECINPLFQSEFSVVIPGNASALQLSIILKRLQITDMILEHLSQNQDMQHVLQSINNQLSNDLMLLARLKDETAIQILVKYGKLLVKRQFRYRNVMGLGAVGVAIREGNCQVLKYFLGLCHEKELNKTVLKHLKSCLNVDYFKLARSQRDLSADHMLVYKLMKQFTERKYPQPPEWLISQTDTTDEADTTQNLSNRDNGTVEPLQISLDDQQSQLIALSQQPIVRQISDQVFKSQSKDRMKKMTLVDDNWRASNAEISDGMIEAVGQLLGSSQQTSDKDKDKV